MMVVNGNNFRCRVGHAWTGEALLDARNDEVEQALWIALRSLQEKARMADNVGSGVLRKRYTETADEAEHAMSVLGKRLSGVRPMADEAG
jgi:two-component system chemotaxis response regulator CheB